MNNWNNLFAWLSTSLDSSTIHSLHRLQSYLQNVNHFTLFPSLKLSNCFPFQILRRCISYQYPSPWSNQSLFHLRLFLCFSASNALPQDLHVTGSFLTLRSQLKCHVQTASIHSPVTICLNRDAKAYQNYTGVFCLTPYYSYGGNTWVLARNAELKAHPMPTESEYYFNKIPR